MDNKKYIGILIVVIGLVALVGFIYFMFFYDFSSVDLTRKSETSDSEAPIGEVSGRLPSQPDEASPQRAVINIKKRSLSGKVTEEDLKRMAASFAERFGSYSNQANYGNIKDLKIFMSAKMKKWADEFIKEETAKNTGSGVYYGITTKAIAEQVNRFDDDSGLAEIVVSARRREAIGALGNTTGFQQDIVIGFVKEGGVWMVDSAVWRERQRD